MTTTMQGSEMFAQMTGRAVEAFSVLADANQKIMRDLVDLSASTAKEGVRLYAELSASAVEALKDTQSYILSRQSQLQDAPRDPFAAYQKSVLDSVEGTQKAFKIFESNAQAMTRSAERLQPSRARRFISRASSRADPRARATARGARPLRS